jgi:hypothetical protein
MKGGKTKMLKTTPNNKCEKEAAVAAQRMFPGGFVVPVSFSEHVFSPGAEACKSQQSSMHVFCA